MSFLTNIFKKPKPKYDVFDFILHMQRCKFESMAMARKADAEIRNYEIKMTHQYILDQLKFNRENLIYP